MKKIILLSLAVVALATTGFAQKPPKVVKAPTEIACAVMPAHKLNIAKATKDKMFADHKGRRYFFCCAGCPGAFKADPAKYAKNPSIPIPAKPKK